MRFGLTAIALCIAGCGGPEKAPASGTLVVLAAASLTEGFTELEQRFEADHPGVDAQLSFAGSQTLATQAEHGLLADVIAVADAQALDGLRQAKLVEEARPFARNQLVLAIRPGLDAVTTLEQLPEVTRLVLADPDVPAGRYADAALGAAAARFGPAWGEAVRAKVVSREASVRLTLSRLTLQEADAAVVYRSDLVAVPTARAVAWPPGLSPEIALYQAQLRAAPHPELAKAWIALVESEAGQQVLVKHGFLPGSP